MIKDISLGRYCEGNSVLHKTDPRVKIILYMVYLIAIFMIKEPVTLALVAVVTTFQICIAKIPLRIIMSTVTPIVPLVFFIFLLNLFSLTSGNVLWQYSFLRITDFGIERAILMSLRLFFLIISTSIFLTLTTTPLRIADALESLMAPLKIIKVPVHEMAMMMSIALRFIPTLIRETEKIMNAQVSRGADYDTGGLIKRVKGYTTVLIPLFVSSFKRAEELAVAMDARCYKGGGKRTKLNPLKLKLSDVAVGLSFTIMSALIVAIDFVLR